MEVVLMLRVIGIIAVVWIGLMILGAIFKVVFWPLLIAALAFAGFAGYRALKARSDDAAIR
ncbi:MAG: hypothetical protein ACR2GE_14350 [Pseudonocardia sp.]